MVSHNIIYNPQSVYVETQVDMAQHTANMVGHSHPTAGAQVATRAQVKRLILIHHSPIEALNYSADLEHVRQIFPLIEVG